MALSVLSVSTNSMCPNPLNSPVSLSSANRISEISPHSANAALKLSSSTWKLRLPQNTVVQPSGFSDGALGALIGFGVEYLMLSQRPSKSSPFSFIQASHESRVLKMMTAVPELRPSN